MVGHIPLEDVILVRVQVSQHYIKICYDGIMKKPFLYALVAAVYILL